MFLDRVWGKNLKKLTNLPWRRFGSADKDCKAGKWSMMWVNSAISPETKWNVSFIFKAWQKKRFELTRKILCIWWVWPRWVGAIRWCFRWWLGRINELGDLTENFWIPVSRTIGQVVETHFLESFQVDEAASTGAIRCFVSFVWWQDCRWGSFRHHLRNFSECVNFKDVLLLIFRLRFNQRWFRIGKRWGENLKFKWKEFSKKNEILWNVLFCWSYNRVGLRLFLLSLKFSGDFGLRLGPITDGSCLRHFRLGCNMSWFICRLNLIRLGLIGYGNVSFA